MGPRRRSLGKMFQDASQAPCTGRSSKETTAGSTPKCFSLVDETVDLTKPDGPVDPVDTTTLLYIQRSWEMASVAQFLVTFRRALSLSHDDVDVAALERAIAGGGHDSSSRQLHNIMVALLTPSKVKALGRSVGYENSWELALKKDMRGKQDQYELFEDPDSSLYVAVGGQDDTVHSILNETSFSALSPRRKILLLKALCEIAVDTIPAVKATLREAENSKPKTKALNRSRKASKKAVPLTQLEELGIRTAPFGRDSASRWFYSLSDGSGDCESARVFVANPSSPPVQAVTSEPGDLHKLIATLQAQNRIRDAQLAQRISENILAPVESTRDLRKRKERAALRREENRAEAMERTNERPRRTTRARANVNYSDSLRADIDLERYANPGRTTSRSRSVATVADVECGNSSESSYGDKSTNATCSQEGGSDVSPVSGLSSPGCKSHYISGGGSVEIPKRRRLNKAESDLSEDSSRHGEVENNVRAS